MKELRDYTDDELRNELKRRSIERRKTSRKEIVYVEFEATIKEADTTTTTRGKNKFKPFQFWRYCVTDSTSELAELHPWCVYYLKQGAFNRCTAPKVGDRVKLRYRRTKCNSEIYDFKKAKIVEIIKVD